MRVHLRAARALMLASSVYLAACAVLGRPPRVVAAEDARDG